MSGLLANLYDLCHIDRIRCYRLCTRSKHAVQMKYSEGNHLFPQVALVGQEPVLFARSVEQNIAYGLPAVPVEVVVSAAKKANAHDFVSSLSKGYDTGE